MNLAIKKSISLVYSACLSHKLSIYEEYAEEAVITGKVLNRDFYPQEKELTLIIIRNYAEHLYIHPGDSIHVEIDFKDLFHPKVTGDAEKLNQEILAFTESAYYYILKAYSRHAYTMMCSKRIVEK